MFFAQLLGLNPYFRFRWNFLGHVLIADRALTTDHVGD